MSTNSDYPALSNVLKALIGYYDILFIVLFPFQEPSGVELETGLKITMIWGFIKILTDAAELMTCAMIPLLQENREMALKIHLLSRSNS